MLERATSDKKPQEDENHGNGEKNASVTESITLELGDQDSSRFTVPVRKEEIIGQ